MAKYNESQISEIMIEVAKRTGEDVFAIYLGSVHVVYRAHTDPEAYGPGQRIGMGRTLRSAVRDALGIDVDQIFAELQNQKVN